MKTQAQRERSSASGRVRADLELAQAADVHGVRPDDVDCLGLDELLEVLPEVDLLALLLLQASAQSQQQQRWKQQQRQRRRRQQLLQQQGKEQQQQEEEEEEQGGGGGGGE